MPSFNFTLIVLGPPKAQRRKAKGGLEPQEFCRGAETRPDRSFRLECVKKIWTDGGSIPRRKQRRQCATWLQKGTPGVCNVGCAPRLRRVHPPKSTPTPSGVSAGRAHRRAAAVLTFLWFIAIDAFILRSAAAGGHWPTTAQVLLKLVQQPAPNAHEDIAAEEAWWGRGRRPPHVTPHAARTQVGNPERGGRESAPVPRPEHREARHRPVARSPTAGGSGLWHTGGSPAFISLSLYGIWDFAFRRTQNSKTKCTRNGRNVAVLEEQPAATTDSD